MTLRRSMSWNAFFVVVSRRDRSYEEDVHKKPGGAEWAFPTPPTHSQLSPMPSPTQTYDVAVYRLASEVPNLVLHTLREYPVSGNIILPHLEEFRVARTLPDGQVWIVCVTTDTGTSSKSSVDFVLSCTDGKLGPLPVFIFTTFCCDISTTYARRRLADMAAALARVVPQDRVFSVFAQDIVAKEFTDEWTRVTNVALHSNPVYYHASLMLFT